MAVDLSLLRTFLAVYRAGTLTGAAEQLRLSQPTVTTQLRALEKQLDQQLFQRLPRGVAPTPVADELAAKVGPHIDALAKVAERGATAGEFARPVHLAGPAELITARVMPALASLVASGLQLRVTTGLADELLSGLVAGRFDLVLSTVRPRGRTVHATPLTDEEFVLVAAPSWARRLDVAERGPSQLADVPLLAYAEDLPLLRRYWRTVFESRLTRMAALVLPDLRGVLAAAVAGAGVTVLPRYLCADELRSGALVPLLEPAVPPINTLFLATRTAPASDPHLATIHNHLVHEARTW
ncbi:LysR family transcriptional regulator [Pseudonocardia spinosispora]|uniref:LysR family transcriptional regulator n=1 Tax=Pseudonocardia spinosispora TaxID=103441 RepID=UPI0012EB6CE5|nr:LysR family transcriptional regulator [Pseudonocardia spinosispora]